ncbi:MAG: type II secretion system protein [Planctomycetota bacterium]
MKSGTLKSGFTLIEMLLVVAIIAVLVAMVVGLTKRIDDQGKERLCRDTLVLIDNALEQFRDFGYEYKHQDFAGLAFPLDCNDYGLTSVPPYPNLQGTLTNAINPSGINIDPVSIGVYGPEFSGSGAMYFILSQIPDCRTTLGKIDKSLLINEGTDKITDVNVIVTTSIGNIKYPFTRVIDPWGKTLRYDYYPDFDDYVLTHPADWNQYIDYIKNTAKLTFPVITSAGPDGKFDTADDIINRQPK